MKLKKIGTLLLSLCLVSAFMTPTLTVAHATTVEQEEKTPVEQLQVQAKAAIAADSKTGQILYAKNIDQVLPIASMTKMLSCAVILDAIQDGKLNWEQKVTISPQLAHLSQNSELSNVPLTAGKKYSVKDLFCATIIESANAAVMALADAVAGNQKNFVDLMRAKLKSWGIVDAQIISVSGLNNKYLASWRYPGSGPKDENQMSARDVALVANHLIQEYPEYLQVSKLPSLTFGDGEQAVQMHNWNQCLPGLAVATEGVDGLKTGTTEKAGACFAGTAKRGNWRITTVVMDATNGLTDKSARFVQTKNLIDAVYQSYTYKTLAKKGESTTALKCLPVKKGKVERVPLVFGEDVKTYTLNTQTKANWTVSQKETLIAPIEKGEAGAKIRLAGNTKQQYLQEKEVPSYALVAKEADAKANFFVLCYRKLCQWLHLS